MANSTDSAEESTNPERRATFGEQLALGVAAEFAFWCVMGILWLAFSGGVAGAIVAIILGVVISIVWRDVRRRSERPPQHTGHNE
jgi:hypothetical protein